MGAMNLKNKMALSVSILFVCFITIMAWIALAYFEREIKEAVAKHQLALAGQLAVNIDDMLEINAVSLQSAATSLSGELPAGREAVSRYLEGKTTLLYLFNAGIFLAAPDGTPIAAAYPSSLTKRESIPLPADLVREVVTTRKSQLSKAFVSSALPGQPLLIFAAPVLDREGRVAAILSGTVNLLGQRLFYGLVKARIGETGYVYLYDSRRTIILHPDNSRIMKRDVPVGANRLFDMALNGFEGSGETVNSRGVHMLSTFKHLGSCDWILAVNFPASEAYAPIFRARSYLVAATAASSLLVLTLSWFLMRRLTAPLVSMTEHVNSLPLLAGRDRLITVRSGDEIGTLAAAFNDMIEAVEQKQRELEMLNEGLEQRVLKRTEQLAEANRELEAFNYSLSHDLRTPLNLLSGYVELIRESCSDRFSPDCQEYLAQIAESGERMTGLVEAMLEFSRTNHGELSLLPVDLGKVVRELAVGKRLLEPDRKADIRILDGMVAFCDPCLMKAALGNLFDNAWKFTSRKQETVIEFGMREDGGRRVFFIRDNGDGFDMAQAGQLFMPFRRLHSYSRFPGSGIGLATVKRIIERHGGKITAEAEPGKGAVFYFTLSKEEQNNDNLRAEPGASE